MDYLTAFRASAANNGKYQGIATGWTIQAALRWLDRNHNGRQGGDNKNCSTLGLPKIPVGHIL
ncbi:hypothetical protein [Geobacter sp. AOG2]|uniref:hypothetical protein n=1 Tax=Geobacter sp. AOG2 TaxID=1566347 RepID=UPI001CC382A5|nr:hypothetical protein [Geobacter sp. AOG2]